MKETYINIFIYIYKYKQIQKLQIQTANINNQILLNPCKPQKSMSYYNPLYPSIQATRDEIQRSILALQDKLRLRRQIDMDLQLSKNQQYTLAKQAQLAAYQYQDQLKYRDAINYNINNINNNRFYSDVYDRTVAQRLKYAAEDQFNQIRHLDKLQQLDRERLQLSLDRERERINSALVRSSAFYDNDNNRQRDRERDIDRNRDRDRNGYQQDDALIKKYEDGTRARQYKYQIDSYNQSKSKSKYNSANKNSNSNSNYKNSNINNNKGINSQFDRSPYNNLKYDSNSDKKVLTNQYLKNIDNDRYQNQNQSNNYNNNNNNNNNNRNNNNRDYDRNERDYRDNRQPRFGNADDSNLKDREREGYIQRERERGNSRGDTDRGRQRNISQNRNGGSNTKGILKNAYNNSFNMNGNIDNQEQNQKLRNSKQQTFGYAGSGYKGSSRGRSKSHKELQSSKRKLGNSQLSPYRSYLDQNDRSPGKSQRSAVRKTNFEKSRYDGPPEVNAMQRIKNRLKLSEIVYKDSKFKNIKHQLSHLFNTYDCQFKLRKQIKQKINSHPIVLKKHAMVVQ